MQDQPSPKQNDGVPIWDLVIRDATPSGPISPVRSLVLADMRERDRVGRERYGTPLQAHNGRDYLVDAYQEAMDLCAYLRQGIEEEFAARGETSKSVVEVYGLAMGVLVQLRKRLLKRDGK
jgi:hypothetical protein